ncbi:hypothetical protein KDL01_12315 [Actinospica durhamensis]|uniref:Uncharacterized protein n=1 Tax=Actinospica durhamensis TaxID=1508375 RepID=A0A941ES15_9ACTN|nr:hypothetical protein [Actinospica durhamensis]MBR7834054.1 hypothetical protein [Actinospica durhamensis]
MVAEDDGLAVDPPFFFVLVADGEAAGEVLEAEVGLGAAVERVGEGEAEVEADVAEDCPSAEAATEAAGMFTTPTPVDCTAWREEVVDPAGVEPPALPDPPELPPSRTNAHTTTTAHPPASASPIPRLSPPRLRRSARRAPSASGPAPVLAP